MNCAHTNFHSNNFSSNRDKLTLPPNRHLCCYLCLKSILRFLYLQVILLGAIVLLANTDEQHLQKTMTNDGDLTLIDALYLSTVTACTIGYGHTITPLSGFIKGFFIVYMFVSTYVVGQIIGELSGLHISIKEDAITAVLIDSTTWVHKADIDGDGKITEADYVLYKLQQMQKVNQRNRKYCIHE